MSRKIKAGSVSMVDTVFVRDTSVTDRTAGLAGVLFNAASFTCYYKRSNGSASVQVPLVDITTLGTFAPTGSNGGFKAVDGTNMPGLYEFQPPNTAIAAGAKSVDFFFRGAANMEDVVLTYELDAVDYQDANTFGLAWIRGIAAGVLAKVSGAGTTTMTFRDVGDTKNVIVATVDASGNRSALTLDLT